MMFDFDKLARLLSELGLDAWRDTLEDMVEDKLRESRHGNLKAWQSAVYALPRVSVVATALDAPVVSAELPADVDDVALSETLKELMPWRKGPFRIGPVQIDTEWRSDMKWTRLEPHIADLERRRVLDIGCGNGYYAYRMLGAGASSVIGLDPTLLYVAQFAALSRYLPSERVSVMPLRLEELPPGQRSFDTAFSMGVLYHQRSPIDHLRQVRTHVRPGGEVVLETLVLPGDEAYARTPPDRYARMRNVWLLPSIPELLTWMDRCGYRDVVVVDETVTTTEEQRPTDWMQFESLAQALDVSDPTLTVEGWPAPRRAILTATVP